MKLLKTLLATGLTLATILAASSVFATKAEYTYEAAKLVRPVTVDGAIGDGEWEDANALVVNADNETFKSFGRWQGGAAPQDAKNLSVTYKIKWDETNLYVLEERMDTAYYNANADALAPWTGDGTLFFLAVDDGSYPLQWKNVYEPFWTAFATDDKPHVAVRKYFDDVFESRDDADTVGNYKFASSKKDNVYTIEVVIPFSEIAKAGIAVSGKEGTNFRFTPILSNAGADGADWDQLNFYDNNLAPDTEGHDGTNGTELPENWAAMKLIGTILTEAPVTEAPVAEAPAAPVAEAPADVPAAPQTNDMGLISLLGILVAGAGVVVVAKGRKASK